MRPGANVCVVLCAVTLAGVATCAVPAVGAPETATSLGTRINAALRGSTAPDVDYRVIVYSAAPGTGDFQRLATYSRNSTRATPPASNEKLFTSIAALTTLPDGPQFRYDTKVYGTVAPSASGTLHGDLVLIGSGDPTLTKANLQGLADRLFAAGVHHVTGRLVVDDTRYSHHTRAVGWKHDFVPDESGTVDAFTVSGNSWRGGQAFQADPTPDNAALWRKALRRAHVSVAGRTTIAAAPTQRVLLVGHESEDLAAMLDATLTNSLNFNAEMLFRELGAQRSGHGTIASGAAAVRAVARTLDLPIGTVEDGSGLSYAGRETPATITTWLTKLATLPSTTYLTEYYALPLSCETGTLATRLCGPLVKGVIRAKTGTLDHNTALSGYLTTASGRFIVYSILLSGFPDKNLTRAESHVNAAVTAIARNAG